SVLRDSRGVARASGERGFSGFARGEAERPFDLARGPLSRGALARLSDAEHVLVLTCHHIVADGWAPGVFVREVAALSRAFAERLPLPLPEPSLTYRDFARWQ